MGKFYLAFVGLLIFWAAMAMFQFDAFSCTNMFCGPKARKITNERGQQKGDIYNPGHGRRLQIRDNRRRIIGYIERNGTVTDTRRRKIGRVK